MFYALPENMKPRTYQASVMRDQASVMRAASVAKRLGLDGWAWLTR